QQVDAEDVPEALMAARGDPRREAQGETAEAAHTLDAAVVDAEVRGDGRAVRDPLRRYLPLRPPRHATGDRDDEHRRVGQAMQPIEPGLDHAAVSTRSTNAVLALQRP